MEQVPMLEIVDEDGNVTRLTQSLAIIEYLEDAFPGRNDILPKNALQRARARQVSYVVYGIDECISCNNNNMSFIFVVDC